MGSKIHVGSDTGSNKTADVAQNTISHPGCKKKSSQCPFQRISLMMVLGESIRAGTNAK